MWNYGIVLKADKDIDLKLQKNINDTFAMDTGYKTSILKYRIWYFSHFYQTL